MIKKTKEQKLREYRNYLAVHQHLGRDMIGPKIEAINKLLKEGK